MRYHIGDELILKVKDKFGTSDDVYRTEKVQIIGYNIDADGPEAEYLVYVPPYSHLKNSFILTVNHARWYHIESKFIGDDVAFIPARHAIFKHIPAAKGEKCGRCNEFTEGAERDYDGIYMCRACRIDPYR